MALEQPATDPDVRALYAIVLDRVPESEAVVAGHVGGAVSVETLLSSFLASEEYAARTATLAAARMWRQQDPAAVALDATPEQMAAMRAHVRGIWSGFGEEQTYWSVLTADEYRDGAIDEQAIERFYASGADHAADMLALLRRNGADTDAIRDMLDFGCGVARLAEPFLRHVGRYTGVDISPGHLRLARNRAEQRGLAAGFLDIDGFFASDIAYDLYYSMIVLQHNPPPIMLEMLREGLRRVRPGGYALFQCPAYLHGYRFATDRYLGGEHRNEGIEMHALPQRAVFAALAETGFTPLEVVPDPQIGNIGYSYVYLARKTA